MEESEGTTLACAGQISQLNESETVKELFSLRIIMGVIETRTSIATLTRMVIWMLAESVSMNGFSFFFLLKVTSMSD